MKSGVYKYFTLANIVRCYLVLLCISGAVVLLKPDYGLELLISLLIIGNISALLIIAGILKIK